MLWTEELVTSMSVVITSAGTSPGKCESKVAVQCSKEVKDIAMSSSRVAENNSETSAMSRQNDLSLDDDPLEEIRLAWVDDPVPIHFMKHRSLIRYARDLKMITDVMRDYSKSHDCVEKAVLDATLEYGKKAHNVYCNGLHQLLHDNPDSLARDKVESLVRDYPEKEGMTWRNTTLRQLKILKIEQRALCSPQLQNFRRLLKIHKALLKTNGKKFWS